MQELKVIGVESGALVAAGGDGVRFRIAIDEVLRSSLRQRPPEIPDEKKPSPRQIQALIRSGLSAEDVAQTTDASLEYIQRFEGAILAERNFIVSQALAVPVHTAGDLDPLEGGASFGEVIRDRLAALNATEESWTSWKEEDGDWIVRLSFTVDEIEHDARWTFEPKKLLLAPSSSEAMTLSQHTDEPPTLIPRLRAVGKPPGEVDESRFDSGAFRFTGREAQEGRQLEPVPQDQGSVPAARPMVSQENAASHAAINRSADDAPLDSSATADLLDTLRRRRGEREVAGNEDEPGREQGPRLVDVPLDVFDNQVREEHTEQAHALASQRTSKKARAQMPSWDEIVFGARSDDDPA